MRRHLSLALLLAGNCFASPLGDNGSSTYANRRRQLPGAAPSGSVCYTYVRTILVTGISGTSTAPANGATPAADPEVSALPLLANAAGAGLLAAADEFVTSQVPYSGSGSLFAPVTIQTIAPSNGAPGTFIVATPAQAFVTSFQSYTGTESLTAPTTVSTIPPSGDQPGTFIVVGPVQRFATAFQPYTGSETLTAPTTIATIAPSGDQPGTYVVATPAQGFSTSFQAYTGSETLTAPTTIATIAPSGDQPGVFIVATPVLRLFATSFQPYTGLETLIGPTTLSTIAPSGTQPGTFVVTTPPSFATSFQPYTGTESLTAPTTISTVAPSGGLPGTFIVQLPPGSYVTSTLSEPAPGAEATTVSTIPPTGSVLGTYLVQTPQSFVISTQVYTGSEVLTAPITLSTVAPSGTEPGTVIIATPRVFLALTLPFLATDVDAEPTTVSTIVPSDGGPGIFIVNTPVGINALLAADASTDVAGLGPATETGADTSAPVQPSTSTLALPLAISSGLSSSAAASPSGSGSSSTNAQSPLSSPSAFPASADTADVGASSQSIVYITITQVYTGTESLSGQTILTTIPPESGALAGLVIVATPSGDPTSAADATSSAATAVNTDHSSPSVVYITITQLYTGTDALSGPTTLTTIPPESGALAGLVIVATPSADPGQSQATDMSPASSPAVTNAGDSSPSLVYITITQLYTGTEVLSGPTTTTIPPESGALAGLVIIATPGVSAASDSSATSLAHASSSMTATTDAGSPSPTVVYITITQLYTGTESLSGPTTTTIPPESGALAGLVVIATPGVYTTITELYSGAETLTGPSTSTTIAPSGTLPGTVLVVTPAAYTTVTQVFTGAAAIPSPTTFTISPMGTAPDTILVQLPEFTTVTRLFTGSSDIAGPTTTTIPASGSVQGTVCVQLPRFVTVTQTLEGSAGVTVATTVTISPSGEQQGTVFVQFPAVTISASSNEGITSSASAEVASSTSTEVSSTVFSTSGSSTSSMESSSTSITPEAQYTTITEAYTGLSALTAPTTITNTPTGTELGAVVVQTPPPAFRCEVGGYLIQNTQLFGIDIASGNPTLINANVGDGRHINAIGYNGADNYIYGAIEDRQNPPQLIRIAADGSSTIVTDLPVHPNASPFYNDGDIDEQGRYWIAFGGDNVFAIDLAPGSTNYGQVVLAGTGTNPPFNIGDWAYVPGGGDYLWALASNQQFTRTLLARFDRTAFTWEVRATYGNIAGSNTWGAMYATNDGRLFATENESGEIWQFGIDGRQPRQASQGPPSSANDGARCFDSVGPVL